VIRTLVRPIRRSPVRPNLLRPPSLVRLSPIPLSFAPPIPIPLSLARRIPIRLSPNLAGLTVLKPVQHRPAHKHPEGLQSQP
jgi:hypothetical protein